MKLAAFNATCPFEIGDKIKSRRRVKPGEAETFRLDPAAVVEEVHTITDIVCVHSVKNGTVTFLYPYLAEDIEETARIKAGAGHTVGVRVDIYPHVYRKMGADWRALCAAYIQQTGKLEIFPQNRTEA